MNGKTTARETEASLRHWLEAVPNDRLAHLVRDAARSLARSLQIRLAENTVSFGHWVFLRILWESDGLTQREHSTRAGVMEPTTFAAVKALEKQGYIARRKRAGNRKNVYVQLTAKGAALKTRLVPLAEAVNEVAVEGIDSAHRVIVRQTLLAMIRNLAQDEMMGAGKRVRVSPMPARSAARQRPRRADPSPSRPIPSR